MKKTSVLLAALCLFANSLFAQNQFSPDIKRVAVFKNGYAFTYREGEAQILNGWAYTTNAPAGVLGTVWGYTTAPNVKITQLLASETESPDTETMAAVSNFNDFLKLNEGARIRVEGYNNKVFEGVYRLIGETSSGNFSIAVQTERGTILLSPARIETIEIIGQAKYEQKIVVKHGMEKRLAIKTDGTADGQKINLGIAALERGIRWIPAYRVEAKGTPVKEAKLELEAMIINELTDLKNSEVYFVVGVPHFLFQNSMSPLSMNSAFAGVSGYFQPGAGANRADSVSNAIMSQVASTNDNNFVPDAMPTVSEEEKSNTFSAEQLFLYQANNINLKKGERASLRLFSLTVPASDVFEWTLTDAADTQNRYLEYGRNSTVVPLVQDLSTKIWYGLRLKNQTGMPWTTAPAMSFREWKPMGQDMLTFTPINGENILRVSPATEVTGTHTLEEKERVKVKLNYANSIYDFDLVTVEGAIKLRSIKKEPVELVITRNLVGDVLTAADNGKAVRQGINLQGVNPNSTIKWNLSLPSGEKEIRYTYKIYVRR